MAGGGTSFSIDVSQYQSDLPTTEKASSSSSFSGDTPYEEGNGSSRVGSGIWSGRTVDYSSESSSSIGTPGDSEEEEESEEDNDEEQLGLASMSSLEDSLPSKGLSSHYKGKSKSFGNLGEIGSVKEVPKQENPLNRKRRLQIYNKLARKSFYAWQNPKSMPLLPVHEDDNDEDEEEGEDGDLSDEEGGVVIARRPSFKNRALKSMSCFALSDLQEEEEDEEDE